MGLAINITAAWAVDRKFVHIVVAHRGSLWLSLGRLEALVDALWTVSGLRWIGCPGGDAISLNVIVSLM